MGVLIGLGIGLLEQFAKAAWLKVIRGEFEGKEYLLFAGTTSIGNNGKNTIVLFKDKLVGPHHCDIKLEGSKYVLSLIHIFKIWLFYLLFKCIKLWCRKELAHCDTQAITDHFNRNHLGILAFSVQNIFYA